MFEAFSFVACRGADRSSGAMGSSEHCQDVHVCCGGRRRSSGFGRLVRALFPGTRVRLRPVGNPQPISAIDRHF